MKMMDIIMKNVSKFLSAVILCFFMNPCLGQDASILTAEQQDEMIIIRIDKKTFTCYRYGEGQKYPYFYPVNGPATGLSLTTESSLPYPHHRSLWFGCDRVNQGNYWQEGNERGQIISSGPRIVENGPERIHIVDTCDWKQPSEKPVILDERYITITAPSNEIRIIDFRITLTALSDITIDKTNHSLFSARMHPSLSVQAGGILINAEGKSGEKATAGRHSSWCDYSGERFGIVEGLAILDSPQNRWFPSQWFTRDYGFFSPTNLYWLENGFHLMQSESVVFQYRVIVHAGDSKTADIKSLYSSWVE